MRIAPRPRLAMLGAAMLVTSALLGSMPAQAAPPVAATATKKAPEPANDDDLLEQVPLAATLSNTWSGPLSVSWVASARLFAGPIEQGISSFVVARVLNGTTWTVLLGMELAAFRRLGRGWGWLERVSFTTDQLGGLAVPSGCPSPSDAGCGLGLGGSDELSARLRGRPVRFTLAGGWIQGRAASDARRAVIESTWVFSPLAAQGELTGQRGPLSARAALGPGLYFGMHAAHAHPETTSDSAGIPWHGLYPLDGGIGIGLRADAALTIGSVLSLGGTLVVAPMLGRSTPEVDPVLGPVKSSAGQGVLAWRMASLGATVALPGTGGVRLGLRYWRGELSSRPLIDAGHHAVSLRWEVPLRP